MKINPIHYADDLLLKNLISALISEGVLSKQKLAATIVECIDAAKSVHKPNKQAILHLEQMLANIETTPSYD